MKVEELFLVKPLDHHTPTKTKNISSLSILPKEQENSSFKLFFYSKTKNCRLPSLYGIILLLNRRRKFSQLIVGTPFRREKEFF